MKTCTRCEVDKDEGSFTRNTARDDGLSAWCRQCVKTSRQEDKPCRPDGWVAKTADIKEYQRQYRKAHPEKFRRTAAQERERYTKEQRKLHGEDWQPRVPKSATMTPDEYRKWRNRRSHEIKYARQKADPVEKQKRAARKKVSRAVKEGRLVRQPCSVCGAEPAHGHHEDYSKPLEVVWLCDVHHREVHGDA